MSLECPNCNSTWKFNISVETTYVVDAKENTIDAKHDFYYDGDSSIVCAACNYKGLVKDFRSHECR